jgi:hypothetical protein
VVSDDLRAWKFESHITDLDGIEIHVSITVPIRSTWTPGGELPPVTALGSIAQSVANTAVEEIAEARNQVPF